MQTDDGKNILIDTPPELRLQLIAAGITDVAAILFTHDHADHVNGIDDTRALSDRTDSPIDMYGPPETMQRLSRRFEYIFNDAIKALPGTSKPEGRAHSVQPGETLRIGGTDITAVAVPHGPVSVYGYRIGRLGYVTDAKELPEQAISAFRGVSVLVLNALFKTPHPTHLSIPEAVDAAKKVGAPRTFLTHLTHRTGHAALEANLPSGIAPAFDGLTIDID